MKNKFYKQTLYLVMCAILNSCGTVKTKQSDYTEAPKPQKIAFENPAPNGKTDAFLNDILQKDYFLANIINNPKLYNAQIIYTQINRDKDNNPSFKQYTINNDPNFYFYPASTVKMPIAFLALQKINELNAKGINITKESTMITGSNNKFQTEVYNDPTTEDGKPTIANYIKKIFLISDNDAFSRLYEFLGQDYINSNLQKMGFKSVEILHRLSVYLPIDQNKITNPITFYDGNGKIIYEQAAQWNTKNYSKRNDLRGAGFIQNGKLINKPFDFSQKNRINLNDLNTILKTFIFSKNSNNSFNLTADDRSFLLKYMSEFPKESNYPTYNEKDYWDSYVKFNLYGSEKKTLPKNIRIFNKVGDAYGYFTDISYIVDLDNKIEFMLSATIYANKDNIINDDKYDNIDIAMPFFKKLGEQIYNYEKKQSKTKPDLTEFKISY